MPRIHRQEWLLALTLSLIILIISGLPFLYGYLLAVYTALVALLLWIHARRL